MTYEVDFSKRAILEILDVLEYYSESEKTLIKFNQELNKCITVLERNPMFNIKYKNMRAIPINKFPYIILFTVENHHVYIYSIFNSYQDPKIYP